MKQQQRIFFGNHHPQYKTAPDHDQKLLKIDEAFRSFVGNEAAVKKLKTAAYTALGRFNHVFRDLNFAFFGPASAGKTTLARLYAESVELPFLEISPKQIKTTLDLLKEISKTLDKCDMPLVLDDEMFRVPPMVIFIDEVHALSNTVVQNLLKATEFNDAVLKTEGGQVCDMSKVTWMIATTDEGKLFDAFRSRFSAINLRYLNKKEVAQVVHNSNLDLDLGVCELISHYNSRITRKALEFARYVRLVKNMRTKDSWEVVVHDVAREEGIDEHGMQEVHLKILKALGNGPISQKRIHVVSGRKEEETERYIMPWLMTETDDQPALVTVTGKGYTITSAGIEELRKRQRTFF